MFSRFLVDEAFAEEFKQCVLSTNSVKSINDRLPLALQSGPGATVRRALKDPAYMPMVVHLSMFGATHEFGPLAEFLSNVIMTSYEKSNEGSMPVFQPAAIRGAIQACVEQTAGFRWELLVHTVRAKLGLPAYDCSLEHERTAEPGRRGIYFSLSQWQFESLLEAFLLVNRLHRDHTIVSTINPSEKPLLTH